MGVMKYSFGLDYMPNIGDNDGGPATPPAKVHRNRPIVIIAATTPNALPDSPASTMFCRSRFTHGYCITTNDSMARDEDALLTHQSTPSPPPANC
jgi:hypothetical protein